MLNEKTTTIQQLQNKARYSKEYDNAYLVATNIILAKKQINLLKLELEKNSKLLLDYMVENDIEKIIDEDSPSDSIQYQDTIEKLIVDSKKLKTEYNQIYNNCVKVSTTKAHLVVKA